VSNKTFADVARAAVVTALAFVFAGGLAVMTAQAGQGHEHGKDGKASTCPHAAAAAAAAGDGEAAAPCEHGADGKCATCADAKDCPHSKGEACAHCGNTEKAPEGH
jgi:hypothetical protein